MTDILKQIVEHKKTQVQAAKAKISLLEMRSRAEGGSGSGRGGRDFWGAVTQPAANLRVIAEVKKASPSAGVIRADFDPVKIARAYEANGAAAISCLTDEKFFQGSLDYIGMIKQAVGLPVLRKDFLIDEYQVYEAKVAQADAVLLIAECLETPLLEQLLATAKSLGLTVLLEVHDRENLERVLGYLQSGVLLGINNRNLRTMKVDLSHTLEMVKLVKEPGWVVSESGIKTPADIARLADVGVHRILVGEHLMRQSDPGTALAAIMA